MKKYLLAGFALFSISCHAASYPGEIEKIIDPIVLKLAPHTIKAIETQQIIVTVDGVSKELKNENTELLQNITNKGDGFHFSIYTTQSTSPSGKEFKFSMDVDAKASISNIEGFDNIKSEEEKQLVAYGLLGSSIACHFNVEIRTGVTLCKRNIKKMADVIRRKTSFEFPDEVSYEVEGLTIHEGKKVIVVSHQIMIPYNLKMPDNIKAPSHIKAYQLIDPQTGAILYSDSSITAEADQNGKHIRLEMKNYKAATYQ